MSTLTLACDEHVSAAAGLGCVCIVYRGRHFKHYPDACTEWTRKAYEHHGNERVAVLVVIENHAETPDSASQRAYGENLKKSADYANAFGQLLLSSGLMGSAHRAIVSTIFLFSRVPLKLKVFGAVDELTEWASEYTAPPHPTPTALAAFVESVRTAV
ncbi:MAG: hypothetical protein AAGA54_25620 [Myxococcota bacterium]